jgi:ion channel
MRKDHHQDLPPARPRRVVVWAAVRGALNATVLVGLYYVLPLDRRLDADTVVRLVVGLLVFAGLMVWQLRSIVGSRYPAVRSAEALGLIVALYLLLFASTYFVVGRASVASFTQPLTRTDALYFAVTVFATVGFGDITAKSETARVMLIVRCLVIWWFSGLASECSWGRCAAASSDNRGPASARSAHDGSRRDWGIGRVPARHEDVLRGRHGR